MNQITASIKDPAWWFTVFFAGIIVSIFAGFLKDWVAGVASKYLHVFRERRRTKAIEREALFEALATNETFLVLSMVRLLGGVIVSLLMLGLFTSLPAMLEVKEILCKVANEAAPCRSTNFFVTKIYIVITGAIAMLTNYRASSRFSLVMKGLHRYRKRNNLPKVA